ncbi:MAG: DUF1513 domain-containing protein [Gammaproteobacteria bacterium]|nr:DUF1513 domain-containing protein [Gammaproteobacteria bacterium]
MSLNRRHFLKIIPAGLIANSLIACSHKKFFNPDEDILLSGGSLNGDGKTQHALIIINLTQQEKRVINTPFLPHGINIDPNNKYRIFCFEKDGSIACEIDLQTQEVTRTLHSENNQLFSGHASFSKDGSIIYCLEKNKDNHQGSITIRNTKTFEATHQLPTLGLSPHHCQLSKNNILTVSNTEKSESGFHQPSLVAIDLQSEKLIERIKLDDDSLNCGHFKITDDGDLIIASAPIDTQNKTQSGGVSFRQQNDPVSTMIEPDVVIKRMTGEALSIATDQRQAIAAVTHPEANLLTFWSIKDKKIIKAYGFENPRGIGQTLNKKYFIVSYGNKPAMVKIAIKDLTPQIDSVVQPTLASGEHILNWSANLREIMPKRVYG